MTVASVLSLVLGSAAVACSIVIIAIISVNVDRHPAQLRAQVLAFAVT